MSFSYLPWQKVTKTRSKKTPPPSHQSTSKGHVNIVVGGGACVAHLVPDSPRCWFSRQIHRQGPTGSRIPQNRLHPERLRAGTWEYGPPGKGNTSSKTMLFRLYFNLRGCNHPYLLGLEKFSVLGTLTHVLYELECQRLKLPVAVSHFTIHESGTAALKHAHTYTDKTYRAQQERYDQKKALLFLSIPYSIPYR